MSYDGARWKSERRTPRLWNVSFAAKFGWTEGCLATAGQRLGSCRRFEQSIPSAFQRVGDQLTHYLHQSMKVILLILGAIVVAVAIALAASAVLWRRGSAELVRRLETRRLNTRRVFVQTGREVLPDPVARYFRHVLPNGQLVVSGARLTQEGQFRIGDNDHGWRPFRATQHYSTDPVGFIWDARLRLAPLVNVNVRDAYQGGAASMRASLLGMMPIVAAHGASELNASALQRYLAEAAWFPTALLPAHGLTWQPIDNMTARASLTDSGTTVSLEFRFNDRGEIVSVFAPVRFREVNGQYIPTPWLGRFWNYEERHGILLPIDGEVAWQVSGVSFPYWRGKLVDIEFDFGR